jgi:hypothetical protein
VTDAARYLLGHLPCSVELPAGCGKTETIADLVGVAAERGHKSLVLTHTHAGVDALRRRFQRRGIPASAVKISTVDSWCFDLISSFPVLANISVEAEPDWKFSREYHAAGAQAVQSEAVIRMLRVSYGLLVVDEYQDCQLWQHELVKKISLSIPTCVLGDRLQGIFFFSDNRPVSWEDDVLPHFPPLALPVEPWRWKTANPALGEWLLSLRTPLMSGGSIDLRSGPISLYPTADLSKACWAQPSYPNTTVIIKKWPTGCAQLVSRLKGTYTMIEELEGKHLLAFADALDRNDPSEIAAESVNFAVSCALSTYKVHEAQVVAINDLLRDSSVGAVRKVLVSIEKIDGVRLTRREAWHGIIAALRLVETSPGLSVRDAVVSIRNQIRITGRHPEARIVARPLLIKGLEFDHAVVADTRDYNAHELYVSLTRGARSLTVVSDRTVFSVVRPS